jgi:hypothetical protein
VQSSGGIAPDDGIPICDHDLPTALGTTPCCRTTDALRTACHHNYLTRKITGVCCLRHQKPLPQVL